MNDEAPTADTATRSHRGSVTGSGRLEVRCPNCHAPTEVAVDTSLTDLTCNSCGSHFSLVDQSKATRMAPSLTQLGRFELIERLGVGGFGSVWKARDKELDRTVAIKIPRADGMTGEEQEKFFREARAAAQLRHPNIVSVHEVGRDGDSVYIVSDFVRGVTLGDWLTGQQLTSREAAELTAKIADALHHAHEQGVVHRDLKPANIMIDGDGQPHLMDFGLARRETGEVTMTMDGHVIGTPAYMSPEQAEGKAHTADRRSDVYSLGVILFQLLTGELPFRGNARMLMHQVIHDDPPSPRKLNSNVAKDLETITLRCLEEIPERRYQSTKELSDEISRFLTGEPIHSRPISQVERAWRWTRRNRLVASLGTAFFLALVIGTTVSTLMAIRANRNARLFSKERNVAESNLLLAQKAVDDYLTRVADDARLKQADFNSLRSQLLESAVPFYEQFATQQPDDAQSKAKSADAYARLASIHGMMGEVDPSKNEYEKAISILDELVTKYPHEPAYKFALANYRAELGWSLLLLGKYTQGQPHLDVALVHLSKLTEDFPNDPAYRHKLAHVHEKSGRMRRKRNRRRAMEHFEKAIRLEGALLSASQDNIEYRSCLASASFQLGFLLSHENPERAQSYLKTAAEIQRDLAAARPKDPDVQAALAESLSSLGSVASALSDPAAARQSYEDAIAIQKKVVAQFPSVLKYRVTLSDAHSGLANVLYSIGDKVGAAEQDKQYAAVRAQLAADFPQVVKARTAAAAGHDYLSPPMSELRLLIGKETTVEFRVKAVGGNQHRYLNSSANYDFEDSFTAIVEPNEVANFDRIFATPTDQMTGKIIRVTGKIEERRGKPQVRITNLASQLEVIDRPVTEDERVEALDR